jgi:hypothetical protein
MRLLVILCGLVVADPAHAQSRARAAIDSGGPATKVRPAKARPKVDRALPVIIVPMSLAKIVLEAPNPPETEGPRPVTEDDAAEVAATERGTDATHVEQQRRQRDAILIQEAASRADERRRLFAQQARAKVCKDCPEKKKCVETGKCETALPPPPSEKPCNSEPGGPDACKQPPCTEEGQGCSKTKASAHTPATPKSCEQPRTVSGIVNGVGPSHHLYVEMPGYAVITDEAGKASQRGGYLTVINRSPHPIKLRSSAVGLHGQDQVPWSVRRYFIASYRTKAQAVSADLTVEYCAPSASSPPVTPTPPTSR